MGSYKVTQEQYQLGMGTVKTSGGNGIRSCDCRVMAAVAPPFENTS